MNTESLARALVGGALIGLSASMLLLFTGRIFGVSGIIAGIVFPKRFDTAWRVAILLGLISAGVCLTLMSGNIKFETNISFGGFLIAGFLVGYGTQLGSGCTSGHGVCGMSRLSPRSILATCIFLVTGAITTTLLRIFGFSP